MKKRLAAILLCAALALTFLPAAAMAGGGDWYAWEADDSNGRVHPGETATLIVDTDGDVPAEIVYEWFIFDTGTMAYELIEGESGNTLVVGNVLKYADYACVVTDRSGKSDWVYLYVDVDNEFSVHAPDGDTYTTVSVAPGGSAVLTVEAEGYNLNGITYKWYDGNYNVIAGETAAAGPSYTLENVESTGYYYGEATDVYGSSRSVTFYVYVDNGFSAEAEQEYITVDPGQGAVMTVNVTAEDDSRVTYLWKDSNYNVVEGATTNTLTLERVTKRAYYRCTVSDGYGNSTTVLFTISIDNGFSAEAEEYAVVAAPGENAVMRVVVTAKDPDSVSFKWYDSGYNIIEGETSDSLSVDPTTGYGEYRCYVSDTYGSYANIYFTVSVDNSFSAEAEQESVEVAPGSDAVLKVLVSAADTSKVTYTWYGRGYYAIDGAESDSYTVENVTGYSSYYCYVSDGYGNYEYVYFYVRANNHFTAEAVQSNITVEPGEAAVMEVRVGGDVLTGVTYAWYDEYGYLIEGEVTNSYTAADVTGSLSYRCYVSDGYGSSRSVWFYLGVDNNFSVSAKKTEYTAEPGESVVLKVDITATDSEGMTIVWRDDNYNVIEGAASDSYTIERVASRGWYYCRVEDKYGNYDEIDFYVSVDNGFSAKAVKSTVYAEPGTNAELRLQVTAKDTDGLTIRWYDRSGSLIEGAASDSYTVENVRAYSYYHCDVADKYGNSRTVWFYVYVDNGFSAEPEKMNVLVPQAGGTATLKINVSVKDADGLTIQWFDGTGSIIENAVTDTLTVENVLRRSEYRCRVADKYGSSASFRFSVGVDNGFSVWPVKRDVSAEPGGSAMMKVRLLVRDAEGLNVQWYDGDSNLIQGADALTYTAENVDGAQYYSCVVTDKYGNTGSVWFNVSVGNALSAKAERQNITVAPGETVVMKTLISARDKEGIAIKWYDANYRVINGATSDTLTLENYMRTSRFRCQATDRYGNSSSVWFYVDVENGFSASAVKEDFTVAAGTDVELKVNVTAADREDLRISWYDNEYEYIEESEDAASITVENVLTSCSYNCFVEDKYGNSETIWFYITVDNGFSAYAENPSVKVPAGGSAVLKLNVTATDKTGLEIRWYDFNHDPMEDETGYSVTVTNITRSMEYSCEVEDRYGNREFVWFSIGVDNGLSVRAEKQTQMVAEGGSAVLKAIVSAKDASKLEYRWYDSDYYQIAGLETDTLILDNITESEHYYCDVSDQYGNYVSAGFTVGVANGLSVTAAQSVFKVPAGGSAQLSAVISALDVSGLSIVWYKNGIIIPGAAQTSYTAENVAEYAEYRCEVTDRFGNSGNARFTVAVENAFSVIAEGSKSYVAYGEAVTLAVRCTAADMDGMTYKWSETFRQSEGSYTYYTSKPIPDALSDTLFIPSVTGKRMFSCTVSDKYGNSASLQFDVGVYNDLTVERIGYYNQYAPYGAPLTLSVQVGAIDTVGLECKWTKESNDKYSSSLGGIVLGTGTSYTIPSVTEAGRYVFSAADRFGNEEGCVFAVGPENGLTIELAAGTAYENYVPYGGSITVGFTASAIDAEGLTYQWDGYFIPVGAGSYYYEEYPLDDANGPTVTLSGVTSAVELECTVTDKFGNTISDSLTVGVENGLRIDSADNGKTVYSLAGVESVTLSVTASAIDPAGLSFNWTAIIPDGVHGNVMERLGVTEPSYTAVKAGVYACSVTDKYGNNKMIRFTVTDGGDNEGKEGIVADPDGVSRYYRGGVLQSGFTGLVSNDYGVWYIVKGVLASAFSGLENVGGAVCDIYQGQLAVWHSGLAQYGQQWVYLTNGRQDRAFSGFAENESGLWYVINGVLDLSYTGLVTDDNGTWYVYNGQLASWRTGLEEVSGQVCEIYNGQLATWHSGLMQYGDTWVYIVNGKQDTSYSGLTDNEYGWWYVFSGALDLSFTGLVPNEYGTWYVYQGQLANWRTGLEVVDGELCEFYQGQLATWHSGIMQYGDGWVYIVNGKQAVSYSGLTDNEYGWWYVFNGALDLSFTGLVTNEYGTWYVYQGQLVTWRSGLELVGGKVCEIYNGQLATWHTGIVQYGEDWIYLANGMHDTDYSGLAHNEYGWWYVFGGALDLSFTGLETNEYGTWYVYQGQLADWRTGIENVGGQDYEFYQGQLATWHTGEYYDERLGATYQVVEGVVVG